MNILMLSMAIFVALINIISFSIMLIDKNLAITGKRRVSEGTLFFLAIIFGGLGIYLGMIMFHHKTRKWYFYFGIPLLILQNISSLLLLYQYVR